MQAKEELQGSDKSMAMYTWAIARDVAIRFSKELSDLLVHKQIANLTRKSIFLSWIV